MNSERLEVWCAGQQWCPVTATAAIIGKKWRPVIIHRLLEHGGLGFSALQSEVDGISSKVLSENLEYLEELHLVDRAIVSERPFRVEYTLSDQGKSLRPIIAAMGNWGMQHLSPPEGQPVYQEVVSSTDD
ncbi:winged helix-turn-helix transcriptional regulator [Halomarina litorea]|uniref:winged helix-turn-helix transcriptional regulator n=1 Tax=Halomarina litorea TaxID=2961595 RepID=UPI0020C437CE|nr:helix-turn-helix domain-containing protein [Halomarina sp. BCD28]